MSFVKRNYVDGETVITAENLNDIQDALIELEATRNVPTDVRQAIYTLLENAAYATTGLEDEIAIVQAWAQEVTALTLVPTTLELNNDTPQYITATVVPAGSAVSWSSSDEEVATVMGGIVTGAGNGSCVITATAGNLTATCTVTVTGFATVESISVVYTKTRDVLESDSVESIKHDLVVTATYSDTSVEVIPSNKYGLSGTLEVGTSTLTVYYSDKTATFNVTVLAGLPVEYKRVKYLSSSGMTGQYNGAYIDTGKKFGSSTTTARFLVGMQADSIPSTWTDAMIAIAVRQTGGGQGNNHGLFIAATSGVASPRYMYAFSGVSATWTPDTEEELNMYHDVIAEYSSSGVSLKVDDNETVTTSGTVRAIANGYNITLFGAKNNTVSGCTLMYKGKIYYAIAEQNGTEIFHGIPCVRLSDNKVGIYDIVNSSFKTATSGGSSGNANIIVAGPDFE